MCGIFGYSTRTAEYPGERLLGCMADAQRHRGPDGWGIQRGEYCGLGMLRLRMRAAKEENEPIVLGDGRFAAYNGEIYRDRSGLIPSGGRGEIDALLEPDVERPVDGMFAAAFFDSSTEMLTLTRDLYGIKPLYVRREEDTVMFASEVGAILSFSTDITVRCAAVHQFLAVGRPLDGKWFIADMEPLTAGGSLHVHGGQAIHDSRKWSPEYLLRSRGQMLPSPDALRTAIGESVQRALISNYPVGVAVSGGLDSSIVCAEIAAAGIKDVTLITVRAEGSLDGLSDISDLGLRGTAWHQWSLIERVIAPDEYFEMTKRAVRTFGFPTRMSSSALYLALADAAADCGATTLLVGEGADELFCGYDSYRTFQAGGTLSAHIFNVSLRSAIGKLISAADMAHLDGVIADYIQNLPGGSDWDRLRMSDFSLVLEPLLARADHALMARTIEGRTPFLHGDVPELAFRFSEVAHLAEGGTKQILREAYADRLAPDIVSGRKTHFRAPISDWLAGPLYEQTCRELLAATGRLEECGIAQGKIEQLLSRLKEADGTAADLTYRMLNLAWWLEWLDEMGGVQFV